ncbi:hypothetical protein [Actinoplanes sp. NPDC051494]|uniref:hypothetical protein n=1 Tax=Actinoplanes sp. NPDC051494 TaxID=3363907 RepID=UPI0037B11667
MITLIRSELYRMATIRSSWVSIAAFGTLGLSLGIISADMWGLMAGIGSFGLAVMGVTQHYQHRTAILLYLARPRRLLVLLAQLVTAVLVAVVFTALSGITTLMQGESAYYRRTLTVAAVMAVFGAASAAIARRAAYLFIGFSAWVLLIEGMYGGLTLPLPFTSYLQAVAAETGALRTFELWTLAVVAGAVLAVHRDVRSD